MTSFTVVEAPSSYNIILERPTMSALRVVASTYHQKIKFSVGNRVGEVQEPSSQKCYAETVRVQIKKTQTEGKSEMFCLGKVHKDVEEEQEKVVVVPGQVEKITKIARDLDPSVRSRLLKCLKKNTYIFSWFSSELMGIAPGVAEHKLNIILGSRPIKQKKRHFGPGRI